MTSTKELLYILRIKRHGSIIIYNSIEKATFRKLKKTVKVKKYDSRNEK